MNSPDELTRRNGSEFNKTTILIVEDHIVLLSLLSWDVKQKLPGSRVITAINGTEGLAKARQAQPDLIVTDLVMPEMDGYDLVQALRQERNCRNIPVIGISANEPDEAKTIAFRNVCDDFLAKPLDPDELLEKVSLLAATKRPVASF